MSPGIIDLVLPQIKMNVRHWSIIQSLRIKVIVCIPDDEEREQHQKIQDLHVRKPAVPLLLCPYLARTYVYALQYSHNRINCTVILIF